DDDRVRGGAGRDRGQVLERDRAEAGEPLPPGVRLGREAERGELLPEPLGGAARAARAGPPVGVLGGELARERDRRARVEGGRQQGLLERAGLADGEGGEQQR